MGAAAIVMSDLTGISYLTIELKEAIPRELRDGVGEGGPNRQERSIGTAASEHRGDVASSELLLNGATEGQVKFALYQTVRPHSPSVPPSPMAGVDHDLRLVDGLTGGHLRDIAARCPNQIAAAHSLENRHRHSPGRDQPSRGAFLRVPGRFANT